MRFKILPALVFVFCCLLPEYIPAQDKVVVVPFMEEKIVQCKCDGTLSLQGRWCDQGDGTVMDMSNCLVWLKYASWGGEKPWHDCDDYDDAHTRAGGLEDGEQIGTGIGNKPIFLNDGSVEGDWRLPTKNELYGLMNGDEAIRSDNMLAFNGVNHGWYWTSTTYTGESPNYRSYCVSPSFGGNTGLGIKDTAYHVWPVRSTN